MSGAANTGRIREPVSALLQSGRRLLPGLLVCAVLAAAAASLAQHYGAPVMLLALLLGLAFNFLSSEGRCGEGIEFVARTVLRAGVALLGLRITLSQIAALGWQPVLLVLLCVGVTIATSIVAARLLGFRAGFGLLSGGATAICGASAALALAAALPNHPLKERATLFTVLGVSALSTLAMIAYPMLAEALALDARQSGVFLGATIHDVAQVVGAGFSMSQETGEVATFVKLLRVAMLLPVIALTVLAHRTRADPAHGARPPLLPGFAVAFAGLVALNSFGLVPDNLGALGSDVSRWCLVAAVAALGMKTRLRELAGVGFKPVALMLGETAFLALLALVLMRAMA